MIEKIILSIFEPSRRTKLWGSIILVIVITVIAGVVDYAKPYNSIVGTINDSRYLPFTIPIQSEYPFRLGLDLQGGTHLVYQADLSAISDDEKLSAMVGVRDVIERRVNAFGVAEPDIRIAGSQKDRLNIELAGITEVADAISLIGETPLLEFKEAVAIEETDASNEIILDDGSEITIVEEEQGPSKELVKAQEIIKHLKAGDDFGNLAEELSDDFASGESGGEIGFVKRGTLVSEYDEAIFDVLSVGEVTDEPVLTQYGYHIIEKLEERNDDAGEREVNSRHILIALSEAPNGGDITWVNTELSGKHVVYSSVVRGDTSGEIQVGLTFNDEGKELFEAITERNIGRPVGIFLDGAIISSPTVQQKIIGGQAVITGGFSLEEAQLLSQRLRAGALPVPIELVSQQTIGASLGAESVADSIKAAKWGLLLVILFMIVYYRFPGILASVALLAYGLIVLALFKLWPVTLTLSGIAGFILSIGMAVDANILVFSRLSEELQTGKHLKSSIDDAFKRAWPSIRDGNVSTLITCIILAQFSTSLIKGFAITLAVGIVVSMFSALIITKKLLQLFSSWGPLRHEWLYKVK